MVSQASRAADQEAVDAGGVDQRNHSGVLDPADAAALEVEHRHGQQFREKKEIVRHRKRPGARQMRAPVGTTFDVAAVRSTRLFRRQFQYGASGCEAATKKWTKDAENFRWTVCPTSINGRGDFADALADAVVYDANRVKS